MFKNKGFTLIELLVVVAIIGILASVVLASLNSARSKGRDAKRLSEIKQLMTALEMYYSEEGHYPISSCTNAQPGTGWCNSVESLTSNKHWIVDGATTDALASYLPSDPVDPSPTTVNGTNWMMNPGVYYYSSYGYEGDGRWYILVFKLENSNSKIKSTPIKTCDGTVLNYDNSRPGTTTWGSSCI